MKSVDQQFRISAPWGVYPEDEIEPFRRLCFNYIETFGEYRIDTEKPAYLPEGAYWILNATRIIPIILNRMRAQDVNFMREVEKVEGIDSILNDAYRFWQKEHEGKPWCPGGESKTKG